MDIATFYFGSLRSRFAQSQDWSQFALGVFASKHLEEIQNHRIEGIEIFSYTHRKDSQQNEKADSLLNDGIFLDWTTAPEQYIDSLVSRLHKQNKKLIVNTGWGTHLRDNYGFADILLIESFLGTNSGDDGKWPVRYSRRETESDIRKLKMLKKRGYQVVTLTYGPSEDIAFARDCHDIAKDNGSDFFMYIQAPGWEKADSGYGLFGPQKFNS